MSHEIKEIECAAFECRINDILDAREDPTRDESLIRHTEQCDACHAVLKDYLALDDSLSNVVWDAETLARLAAPTSGVQPNKMWWSVSLAAALLIGFNIMFGSPPHADNWPVAKLPTFKNEALLAVSPIPFDRKPPQQLLDDAIAQASTQPHLTPVSWNEISERLQPVLNPYYQFSAELPGIRPIQSSLHLTIDWVQEMLLKRPPNRQQTHGFGQFSNPYIPIA